MNRLAIKVNQVEAGNAENIRASLRRGLPFLGIRLPKHDGTMILCGSGPSLVEHAEEIRAEQAKGRPVVAIKGAHDWLFEQGIVPDLFISVEPRFREIKHKNEHTTYLLASRCPPELFDHLSDCYVITWNSWSQESECKEFEGRFAIGGGTTSGLRGLNVGYILGYRKFVLFGFDSCLAADKETKRFSGEKAGQVVDVIVGKGTPRERVFYCNAALAQQANEFQRLYVVMPDIEIDCRGDGLLKAILEERKHLKTVSFIHRFGEQMASYRYRGAIPAKALGVAMNTEAQIMIFAKPTAEDAEFAKRAKAGGAKIVADFCDPHFKDPVYQEMMRLADAITCPTEKMRELISEFGYYARVIPDPYEFEHQKAHCFGTKLLWFGHKLNIDSLRRVVPTLEGYSLRVVSNADGAIPWSLQTMKDEFARADIVIIPETAEYKSCNRVLEAIRSGCFVVAEPHPSLEGFEGIWVGDIREGVEWAEKNSWLANEGTKKAQKYIAKYSPDAVADLWRHLIAELSCSGV